MLDTVRLGIPLTRRQFDRIQNLVLTSPNPQWAIFYPESGELKLRRVNGLAQTDQNSFHREIRWDIPFNYRDNETYLIVELSLPKLYYGHNIHLLYNYIQGLELLKSLLEKQFGFKARGKLSSVYEWQLWRVDVCYAWRCPNEFVAQQVIDALKVLHFPRKEPTKYATSLQFSGTTYSLKFYMKLPEFKKHDRKVLLKAKCPLEFVNHCEAIAEGVVRVEATLRRKFLVKRGIKTIADLLIPHIEYEFNPEEHPEATELDDVMFAIMDYCTSQSDELVSWDEIIETAKDGAVFNAPKGYEITFYKDDSKIDYKHQGYGFALRKTDQPTAILQYLLLKFLGKYPTMQNSDEVRFKLNQTFKSVKATRLMSFWLYVQHYGTEKAKEDFGHNSYYSSRREMKKAGVSFIEPPKNLVRLEPRFHQRFRIEVPSEYATNHVDDFRDSSNILNLPINVSS